MRGLPGTDCTQTQRLELLPRLQHVHACKGESMVGDLVGEQRAVAKSEAGASISPPLNTHTHTDTHTHTHTHTCTHTHTHTHTHKQTWVFAGNV